MLERLLGPQDAAAPTRSPRQRLGLRALAATLGAFGLFGRQIAAWSSPQNRYLYFWTAEKNSALLGGILLLALVLFALGSLLARSAWARRQALPELAVLACLMAGVLSQFHDLTRRPAPLRGALIWAGVGALLWLGRSRGRAALGRIARGACLALAPIIPILTLQILSWRGLEQPRASAPAAAPGAARQEGGPIVLVIFDEWSWLRLTTDGRISDAYPNLRRIAAQSLVVDHASAPSYTTRLSLPRLLYQEQGRVVAANGRLWWEVDGVRRPAPEVPSLFDRARAAGYRTVLLGFYLPYAALLGADGADHIVSYAHVPTGAGWWQEVQLMLLRNLAHGTGPITQATWPRIYARLYSERWRDVNGELRRLVAGALAEEPARTLMVLHLPLPHAPFVFEADGRYRGPFEGERMESDSVAYERHLRYSDLVLGEILAALEGAGRLDPSLLILTSDHSWKLDPDSTRRAVPGSDRRVPLVIKWPGQREGLRDTEPFCELGMGAVLDGVLRAGPGGPAPLTPAGWAALSRDGRTRSCLEPQ